VLAAMLDKDQLRDIFVLQSKDGKEQPDEALVALTLIDTLKAVARLHQLRPEMDLSRLKSAIDQLAGDPNTAIQAEARQTQIALQGA
jgi:hypothetical protein